MKSLLIFLAVVSFSACANVQDSEFISEPEENIDETELDLNVSEGYSVTIFAEDLSGARDMVIDELGNMWVSRTSEGIITNLGIENEEVVSRSDVFRNLNKPHGLEIDPQDGLVLYIAEEDKVSRVNLYTEDFLDKLVDLPSGGRHFTRSLEFGPEEKLFISIGSTCDVCVEDDERYASVYTMNKDGSDFEQFASGLRNAVFLAKNPETGNIWVTEMGRDHLGDDLPPDEINILKKGADYGWPYCYGKNVHDNVFDKNQYIQDPCIGKEPSYIDLQAHSAPLGLAFYEGDFIVALHGSWNRSVPVGYKLIRIFLDENGNYEGQEDFISGWLKADGDVLGRPAGILNHDGILYISDDKKGVIYKVERLS